jgi:hypothetical protein
LFTLEPCNLAQGLLWGQIRCVVRAEEMYHARGKSKSDIPDKKYLDKLTPAETRIDIKGEDK